MSIFLIGLNVLCVVVETRDATVKARFCPKQRWSRSAQVGPAMGRAPSTEGRRWTPKTREKRDIRSR